ncbi:MAG: sugar phosphate isomerase/epimerase, partial [Gemmatimonadaceae bacterium]
MPSRRDALKKLAGLSALATLAPATLTAACSRNGDPQPTNGADDNFSAMVPVAGLGLYTVRAEMEKSVEATLAHIAKIGYREVEFAGYFGKSPAEIAAILKTNGLT